MTESRGRTPLGLDMERILVSILLMYFFFFKPYKTPFFKGFFQLATRII